MTDLQVYERTRPLTDTEVRSRARPEAEDVPETLPAALARFQADLPRIVKGNTATVPGKDGRQGYEYDYADLNRAVSAAREQVVKALVLTSVEENPEGGLRATFAGNLFEADPAPKKGGRR